MVTLQRPFSTSLADFASQTRRWRRPGRCAALLWCALARPLRRWPSPVLLGLAFANLLAALVLHPADMALATRMAVDIVHFAFVPLLGAALVCAGASLGPGRSGVAVGTRAVALAILAFGALVSAALTAALVQGWRGDAPVNAAAYVFGIFPGLGMHLAHLVALVVFGQALRRGWVGAAATTALYVAVAALPAASGVDHPLQRFGGRPLPWSEMAGFGPFLPGWIAAAIAWSAVSILLLAAAHVLVLARSRRRLGWTRLRTTGAVAWAAAVFATVAGGWLLANDGEVPPAGIVQTGVEPQPRYARLALDLEILPRQRRVTVRGTAILAQDASAQATELRLGLPAGLVMDDIAVTGERLPSPPRTVRFRLTRPLEPGERLRLAFAGFLAAPPLPRLRDRPRLLANGAAFALADVVPVVGGAAAATQEALLQARVGTSIEQVVVAPGEPTGQWKEEGRSYFEFRTAQAVPLTATIHSGRYLRLASQDSGIVAFVHADHRHLGEALLARIEGRAGGQRLVEVPDFHRAFAAPLPSRGRIEAATFAPPSAGGIVPVSELALLSLAVRPAPTSPTSQALATARARRAPTAAPGRSFPQHRRYGLQLGE